MRWPKAHSMQGPPRVYTPRKLPEDLVRTARAGTEVMSLHQTRVQPGNLPRLTGPDPDRTGAATILSREWFGPTTT